MHVLPGPTKSNSALAWSPDGRFLVAGGTGDGVMVWDVEAGTPGVRVLCAGHGGELLRFCRATGRLYVAFRSGGVWTYDPHTGEERRRRPLSDWVGYTHPAISADGQTVVLCRYGGQRAVVGYAVADDGALLELWSRPDTAGGGTGWLAITYRPGTDHLFGPAGRWWVRADEGEYAFEWAFASTGEVIGSIPLPPGVHVPYWALAPEGDRVAWLSRHDLHVQRLDEKAPRVLPAAEGELRRGVAWAPDGGTIAFASGSAVRLLDAPTLTERGAYDWGTGKVRAIAFSPDGLRAAVSGDAGRGWVTVFDLG